MPESVTQEQVTYRVVGGRPSLTLAGVTVIDGPGTKAFSSGELVLTGLISLRPSGIWRFGAQARSTCMSLTDCMVTAILVP